jgi:eukaryotic-like serine/threonine-protein kinase
MALGQGTRLGPYEIVSPLGAGGMGEVYRARDIRLDRSVAIKVLPEGLAADPEFRDRFDREARVISQLAHPHICTLFDVGRQASTDYLVLEYLEGETLATRIARGAVKPDEALRIATEIAEALEAAHRAGVVHRDLKPGNVMLTKGGAGSTAAVKLLDFGLAKSSVAGTGVARGHMDLTAPPTMTSPLTTQGTILGTFQYMSPEQIEGREADTRSDIWAFGCIVHEMLTGKKAFEGKTQAGLIGAILERDPAPLGDRKSSLPPRLAWILSVCLAKDPAERWQHVRDLLHELRRLREVEELPAPPAATRTIWPLVATGAVAAVAVVALAVVLSTRREPERAALRVIVLPAEGTEVNGGPAAPQAAISPDGKRIVFSAVDAGQRSRLFVRPLDSLEPRPIPGTDEGELPFWSADGRYVAFFTADRKLKKVVPDGEPVQTICDLPGIGPWGGGTWNRDGVILFGAGPNHPIYRVPASGGVPEAITKLDRGQRHRAHLWPAFLADGKRFVFLTTSVDPAVRGIYTASLGSGQTTRLVDATVRAVFALPNHLLFIRDGTLLAQQLDAAGSKLMGEPKAIAEHIAYNPDVGLGRSTFTASDTGVLVYRTGDVGGTVMAQLTWFDRKGARLGQLGEPGLHQAFSLSPDGTRVAVSIYDRRSRQADIWIVDAARGTRTRLTFDAADEDFPIWSPRGEQLAFVSARSNLHVKAATGVGSEETLLEGTTDAVVDDWSPDGQFLIYETTDPKTGADLWILPRAGARTARPLLQTPADEGSAQLSPDGRWLAYVSNESGLSEVYVQPFPLSGAKWQISRDGGTEPRWRADGNELYYLAADRSVAAVEVKGAATFEVGAPVALFRVAARNIGENTYIVARDGRVLANTNNIQTGTTMTVVTDWMQRLK